ncbi:MAG: SGNH/GDSL hydrolase family protein [Clostridium sp.]
MSINLNKEIIKKSLIHKGDISRIVKIYEKAERGEDITIAFLGGSITQGCNSTVYEKCYVELVTKWFKNKFSNITINSINAGVGATGSLIGVHRAEEQVLKYNPDIVFVDAAVNDKNEFYCKVSYESEIKKLLSSKCQPAVIEVFMTMVDGVNVQEQQIKIGKNYNLPMISFRETAKALVDEYNFKWSDLLSDEVHPNDDGHEIICCLLTDFLEEVYKEYYPFKENIEVVNSLLEKPCVYGDRYINGRILSNKDIVPKEIIGFMEDEKGFQVFQNGWQFKSDYSRKGKLVFEVKCKNLILLYKQIISDKAGKFIVSVNGKDGITIDTYFKDGWGDRSVTAILEESDEIKDYKIEVEVIEEEREQIITILGLMVS